MINYEKINITRLNYCCINSLYNTKNNHNYYSKDSIINEYGNTLKIDSCGFLIRYRISQDSNLVYYSITNSISNISKNYSYHQNGQLKSYWFFIAPENTKIGRWDYLIEYGIIDSIVDYELKRKINFCELLNLKEVIEFKTDSSRISLQEGNWTITNWQALQNNFGIRLTILSDAKKGIIDTLIAID